MKKFFQLCLAFCLAISVHINSQTMSSRFSTSVYSWENQFPDSSAGSTFRAAQSLAINVYDLGMKNVSVYSYIRGSYDLGTASSQNPDYGIYSFYAQWQNDITEKRRMTTRIGRQQVYTGIRTPLIDGIETEYSSSDNYSVMAYFGALPPTDYTLSVLKPYERRSFGGKISSSKLAGTDLALTYYEKDRSGPAYYQTNGPTTDFIRRPDVKERLAAFDVRRSVMTNLTVYAQAQYDFLNKELHRATTDWQYNVSDRFYTAFQYTYRRPNVMFNTIFSAFDELTSNQEIWLRSQYQINSDWSVQGDYANVFYKLKDAWRWSLGAAFRRSSLTYSRRDGYGGTVNSITAATYYPITNTLSTGLSTSYTSFKLADDITSGRVSNYVSKQVLAKSNYSFITTGSVHYLFNRSFNVDVDLQYLSQDLKSSPVFAGYKSDFRMFIRANYWFYSHL